jgi:hypothetical protein
MWTIAIPAAIPQVANRIPSNLRGVVFMIFCEGGKVFQRRNCLRKIGEAQRVAVAQVFRVPDPSLLRVGFLKLHGKTRNLEPGELGHS